jgi:hypothetical protein
MMHNVVRGRVALVVAEAVKTWSAPGVTFIARNPANTHDLTLTEAGLVLTRPERADERVERPVETRSVARTVFVCRDRSSPRQLESHDVEEEVDEMVGCR